MNKAREIFSKITATVAATVAAAATLTGAAAVAGTTDSATAGTVTHTVAATAGAVPAPLVPAARVTSGVRTPPPALGKVCTSSWGCYAYVTGQITARSAGARVTTLIARPYVRPGSIGHSLQEMAVQSADGQQIIEIGWSVDPAQFGDTYPHLFVYHWINGTPTCYNGCGFLHTPGAITPGARLTPGTNATMDIVHAGSAWWLKWNGHVIGAFADTQWHNAFTHADFTQVFGEVNDTYTPTCTDMGNGHWGNRSGASAFSAFTLLGTTTRPTLNIGATTTYYNAGRVTATSFTLGGPGSC